MPTHLTSTFPAFKTALAAALTIEGAGVQVVYGEPGQPSTQSEGIYLGDVIFDPVGRDDGDKVATGRRYRDEFYAVAFTCRAWRAATSPTHAPDADTRAAELLAHLENVIAENVRMGDTVNWCYLDPAGTTQTPFDTGLAVDLSGLIHAHARLT